MKAFPGSKSLVPIRLVCGIIGAYHVGEGVGGLVGREWAARTAALVFGVSVAHCALYRSVPSDRPIRRGIRPGVRDHDAVGRGQSAEVPRGHPGRHCSLLRGSSLGSFRNGPAAAGIRRFDGRVCARHRGHRVVPCRAILFLPPRTGACAIARRHDMKPLVLPWKGRLVPHVILDINRCATFRAPPATIARSSKNRNRRSSPTWRPARPAKTPHGHDLGR